MNDKPPDTPVTLVNTYDPVALPINGRITCERCVRLHKNCKCPKGTP